MNSAFGKTKLQINSGKLDPNDHFLQRATDALSVIKISNSYLRSTLNKKNLDPKTCSALDMIEKAVLRIEAFVDSSKIELPPSNIVRKTQRTVKPIKKSVFALSELFQMAKPKEMPKGIQINFPKKDMKIHGNFYKLVVVFANLIENSIEAMKNNGVINIFAKDSNDFSIIELKDSGPGIPNEIVTKVFSSLYTTKPGGNGLGLKMTKTIIDSHDGIISVRNNPTTFIIKLPKIKN